MNHALNPRAHSFGRHHEAAQAAAAPGRRQAGVRNLLARAAHGELLAQSRRERREVIRAADLPEFRRRVKRFLGRKRPRR